MGDDNLVETSRLPRGDGVKSWRPSGRAGRFRGFGSKRGPLHSDGDIQELVVDEIHSSTFNRSSYSSSSYHLQWLLSITPAGLVDCRASRQWRVGDVLLILTVESVLEHFPLLDTVADYDWQGAASLGLLHSGSDVEITPPTTHPLPPSPSTCTTTSSDSPPSVVTHLPFTPGSSHTRNRKHGHIPRPPNAFMVFRSWLWNKDNLKSIERDNRNVSRIAGRYWNELSEAERAPFRSMAEEAKARHAQLYPEYRYSPGSQKKSKVSQRRSHRSAEVENEKCNKVVDLLLGGVTSCDLAMHLGEVHKKVQPDQGTLTFAVEEAPSASSDALPRNKLKRPVALHMESLPPQPRYKKQRTLFPSPSVSTPPAQYPLSLPVLPAIEERSEPVQTPGPLARTPELIYPPDCMEEFVATEDIPYLSLDNRNDSVGDTVLNSRLCSHQSVDDQEEGRCRSLHSLSFSHDAGRTQCLLRCQARSDLICRFMRVWCLHC